MSLSRMPCLGGAAVAAGPSVLAQEPRFQQPQPHRCRTERGSGLALLASRSQRVPVHVLTGIVAAAGAVASLAGVVRPRRSGLPFVRADQRRKGSEESRVPCRAFPLDGSGRLRLFLDTADTAEWERLLPLGFFHGVTTNPVLLERAGVPCDIPSMQLLLEKALGYPGIQEVMFQAWGEDTEQLVSAAVEICKLDPSRVVVKLPLTRAGIRAAALLRTVGAQRIRLCMTACYSAKQGLIAEGLDADYIAPYLGRMGDMGMDGLGECARMHAALGGSAGRTRILVASIRSVDHMMELLCRGLDTFTFAPAICDALVSVEATARAAEEFEKAARAGVREDA